MTFRIQARQAALTKERTDGCVLRTDRRAPLVLSVTASRHSVPPTASPPSPTEATPLPPPPVVRGVTLTLPVALDLLTPVLHVLQEGDADVVGRASKEIGAFFLQCLNTEEYRLLEGCTTALCGVPLVQHIVSCLASNSTSAAASDLQLARGE